ncbi:hypothetical protein M0R45_010686 [Rubus argutus]|uniref:Uncharacterized protein n=1 Tax=Rubus argutus TaxID=59490 RepID=A0AAW1Y7U7_RUBAR
MGFLNVVIGVTAVLLLFLMSMHLSEAGRVLLDEEENSVKNKPFVLTELKQKGPSPPGGPNPGTNIPGPANPANGHASSTINERNFAGHTSMPPPYANPNFKSPLLTSDLMESKKDVVPAGGPNPVTNIPSPTNPANGHSASTINERSFAGHTSMPPPYANSNFKSPVLTSDLMELKKDTVPASGPNPRTNIPSPANPTNGHVASTINERNFASHTTMPPPYANPNSKSPAPTSDLMESKIKAPVPPCGPNPGTNIPRPGCPANPINGLAASTSNERNFAGRTTMPPPYAYPN